MWPTRNVILRHRCGQNIRLRPDRYWDSARCGLCGKAVDPLRIRRFWLWSTRPLDALEDAGPSAGPVVEPAADPVPERSTDPVSEPANRGANRESPSDWERALGEQARSPGPSMRADLERLARRGWLQDTPGPLDLDPDTLPPGDSLENLRAALERIYKHVRSRCPGWTAAFATPELVVAPADGSAGLFVVEDGWTRIVVDPALIEHPKAARAVLCHEAMHHALEVAGIRKALPSENERLTDCAMFITGLGAVYRAGVRHTQVLPDGGWREAHLGYFDLDEYGRIHRWALEQWEDRAALGVKSVLDGLRQQVSAVIKDPSKEDRILARYRHRHPERDERWVLEKVLYDYAS